MSTTESLLEQSVKDIRGSTRYAAQVVLSSGDANVFIGLRAQLKPINRSQQFGKQQALLSHPPVTQVALVDQQPANETKQPYPHTARRPLPLRAHPISRFSWTTQGTDSTATSPTAIHDTTNRSLSSTATSTVPPQQRPEPVSRFSWTTRNTEITHVTSTEFSEMRYPSLVPRPLAPIIARKRPIPRDSADFNMTGLSSGLPTTNSNKDLPLSPPELASVDIITALEAQLEELAYRRRNVEKLVYELTHLQPKNPLVYDLAARRENACKVERLNVELNEIRGLEHDLGLKHHRAWKRREQEQPSCLWVRRVTA